MSDYLVVKAKAAERAVFEIAGTEGHVGDADLDDCVRALTPKSEGGEALPTNVTPPGMMLNLIAECISNQYEIEHLQQEVERRKAEFDQLVNDGVQTLRAVQAERDAARAEVERLQRAVPKSCACCRAAVPIVEDGRCASCGPDCRCWKDE